AIHALTVGAVGTLVLGMIARTALGHTGRPIVASRRLTAAFGLLTLAAVLRSFGPLLCADDRLTGLYHAAGLAWSLA
ncbi:NnrS family protein, partial [Streptomyces niveiscabiei]|uniref:NnrS family protein n=1 Tax=Streptomyces niveiscabiei TaxID=164115 RepID=UPI0038F61041